MPENFGLYLILTDPVCGYEKCTEAAVAENVRFLQLRMKNTHRDTIIEKASNLRSITRGTDTLFIINDLLNIAMETNADGVHLGQDDMPLKDARRLWNIPGKLFGLSTHNERQASAALDIMPDYIGVGPVYATPAKTAPDPVLGPERTCRIIASVSFTAVAIGGINKDNLRDVLANGAVNFSVVRAVNQSDNPRSAIRELMDIWREHTCRQDNSFL